MRSCRTCEDKKGCKIVHIVMAVALLAATAALVATKVAFIAELFHRDEEE